MSYTGQQLHKMWNQKFGTDGSVLWAYHERGCMMWVASVWHETVPRQQRRIIQISVHTLVLRFKRWPKPDFMMTERRRVDDFGPRRTFASVLGIRFSRLHCRSSWRVQHTGTHPEATVPTHDPNISLESLIISRRIRHKSWIFTPPRHACSIVCRIPTLVLENPLPCTFQCFLCSNTPTSNQEGVCKELRSWIMCVRVGVKQSKMQDQAWEPVV